MQDYVAKGFVFIALKLTAGAGVSEIHPIVFEYEGDEPCVPIKLTAVAATENMGLRVFFLGDDRAVPLNYKHITLNPARIDWMGLGSNYEFVVTRGADSPIANGHAFVTEYAGSSTVVNANGVFSSSWASPVFETLPIEQVVDQLQAQGLLTCIGVCQFNHPLLQALLQKYLPAPDGVDEDTFYSCLPCYQSQLDLTAWDGAAFAAELKSRIIDPGQHAAALLGKWPYLTRMFTTLSPLEMTEDPIFYTRPGLPNVPLPLFGVQRVTCSGQRAMVLPGGREVALQGGTWPAFDSNMPWVEQITEFVPGKEPVVLIDNTAKIDAELKAWNDSQGWPPSGTGGSGAASGTGGMWPGFPFSQDASDDSASGCACGVASGPANETLLVGLGALLAALARRRRR